MTRIQPAAAPALVLEISLDVTLAELTSMAGDLPDWAKLSTPPALIVGHIIPAMKKAGAPGPLTLSWDRPISAA
jgi:hypothetical protein